MKVSLRKASALSAALLDASRKISVTPTLSVSIYTQSGEAVLSEIDTARSAMVTNIDSVLDLAKAGYDIRAAIGLANEKAGVNAILTEKAYLDSAEKTISALASAGSVRNPTVEILDRQLSNLQARAGGDNYYGGEDFSLNVINDDVRETLTNRLADIRRKKMEISDRLLSINLTTEIDLSQSVVDLLNKYKLI